MRPKSNAALRPYLIGVLMVVVSGCGSSEVGGTATEADVAQTTSETEESSDQMSSFGETSEVSEASETAGPLSCGHEFPVFRADPSNDPLNVDGTPGPGPDSEPAERGQMVTHWVGDYANYELRWPARGSESIARDPNIAWDFKFAGFPAALDSSDPLRVRLYLRVESPDDRCSILSAEAYGPLEDALSDESYGNADSLRPRSEVEDYLAVEYQKVVRSSEGLDRPQGQCGELAVAEADPDGPVTLKTANEVVARFLTDRAAGNRAQQCLTESALVDFELAKVDDGYDYERSCLFACEDGFSPVLDPVPTVDDLQEAGFGSTGRLVSAVIGQVDGDGNVSSVREVYEVGVVEAEGQPPAAMIVSVRTEPESFVDLVAAKTMLRGFLKALASREYEEACCLSDAGALAELEPFMGEDYLPAAWLEQYCEEAFCAVPFEILAQDEVEPFGRWFRVRFSVPRGEVEIPMLIGMWEGQLYIGTLPPPKS